LIEARPVDPPHARRVGRKIHDRQALRARCAVTELCASSGARSGAGRSYSEGVRCPTGPVQSDPPGLNPRRPPSLPPGGGRPLTSRLPSRFPLPLLDSGFRRRRTRPSCLPFTFVNFLLRDETCSRLTRNLLVRKFMAIFRRGCVTGGGHPATRHRPNRSASGSRAAVVHNTPVVHSRPPTPLCRPTPARDGGTRATHGPHRRRGRTA
jgi:hypothetical protein